MPRGAGARRRMHERPQLAGRAPGRATAGTEARGQAAGTEGQQTAPTRPARRRGEKPRPRPPRQARPAGGTHGSWAGGQYLARPQPRNPRNLWGRDGQTRGGPPFPLHGGQPACFPAGETRPVAVGGGCTRPPRPLLLLRPYWWAVLAARGGRGRVKVFEKNLDRRGRGGPTHVKGERWPTLRMRVGRDRLRSVLSREHPGSERGASAVDARSRASLPPLRMRTGQRTVTRCASVLGFTRTQTERGASAQLAQAVTPCAVSSSRQLVTLRDIIPALIGGDGLRCGVSSEGG